MFSLARLGNVWLSLDARYFLIVGFCLLPHFAAAETNLELGVSALSFHYKEFPAQERFRNREDGLLLGVNAALRFNPGAWRLSLEGSYHGGKVDYDGATSRGNPHQTDTRTDIYNVMGSVGYSFSPTQTISLTPYAALGYRDWRRDILPNRGVSGLLENYYWFYAASGLALGVNSGEHFRWGVDARLILPINPQLDVDFNSTNLDLDPRVGYRLALPLTWSFAHSQGIKLEPYYERQKMGESPPRNGILEPRSDSKHFGINLNWRFRF